MPEPMLELAEKAARTAGEFLRNTADFRVDSSIGKDIKLSTDRESERIIIEMLSGTGITILSEERGEIDEGTDLRWIIDPLDGTANFWRGMRDLCCVSIALWRGDEPLLGVVYRFDRDEMYSGVVGEGSWMNGAPIATSATGSLSDAFLITGFPVHSDFSREGIGEFLSAASKFKKVRMLGAAALMGSLVAAGKADVYSEKGIMLWDIAASTAIVLAAGGSASLEIHGDRTCDCKLFANKSLESEYNAQIVRIL